MSPAHYKQVIRVSEPFTSAPIHLTRSMELWALAMVGSVVLNLNILDFNKTGEPTPFTAFKALTCRSLYIYELIKLLNRKFSDVL